jgi:hypothetical protein
MALKRLINRAQGDAVAAKKYDEQLAFLTPTLKGFLTEMGIEAASPSAPV